MMTEAERERAKFEPIIIGTDANIPELVKLAKLLLATKSTFKLWQQAYAPLHSAYEHGVEASRREERKRCAGKVVAEIATSTGPTGGWLDSPKAICASLLSALEEKPSDAER